MTNVSNCNKDKIPTKITYKKHDASFKGRRTSVNFNAITCISVNTE